MNIRAKTLLLVGIAIVISALANYLVIDVSVFPKFIELEQDAARKDVQRVIEAYKSEIDNIAFTLWDYTNWDDTYRFVQDPGHEYPEANLKPDSLKNIRMDFVQIIDASGRVVHTGGYDRYSESIRASDYDWVFTNLVQPSYLSGLDKADDKISGALSTPDGLAIFGARPIVKSNGDGPSAGVFFFGRFVDDKLISQIAERTKVDVNIVDLESLKSDLGPEAWRLFSQDDAPVVSDTVSNNRLVTYWLLRDYRGTPIGALRAYTQRDVSQSGRSVVLASVAGVGVAGLVVMGAIAVLLQWLLVGPLVRLTQHVVGIAHSGDLGQRVSLNRADEIGTLSHEFDRMLGRLAEARDQLLEQSYQSGLAEMASGVLHNLRNQLMPINMRLGRLRDMVVSPSQGKLDQALDELKRKRGDPERVGKLANYVGLAIQDIVRRQDGVREQFSDVAQDLSRIEEILHELDRFSHATAQLEAVPLGELVEQTIGLLPEFPDLQVRINVDPGLRNRHYVLSIGFMLKHVLHNLFVNAFEAIIAAGKRQGTIEVSVANKTVDGLAMVDLQIRDDGIGIAPENIQEIFVRGFTTKKRSGRRGTGLHWCANRVIAMGGKVYAESPGVNAGATLHVLLPLATVASPVAAQ